jgi:oligoendopeptidase F
MNAVLGDLPTWNLGDLYSSPTGSDLAADLERARRDAEAFARDYEGKVAGLDGRTLGAAVVRFEALHDLIGRIASYAQLYYCQDLADPKRGQFSQNVSEKLNDVGSKLLFFDLELKKIEDAGLAEKLKDPGLARYAPWLRNVRLFRPHQLSDELEKYQYDQSVVGSSAWSRLFDETIARLRYPFRNELLTEPQILDKLSSKDADVRKEAAKSFGKVQSDNIAVFSLIMNTLVKDKEIDDRWRKYPRPQSFRNLSNVVEDEVVNALASAVKAAYPRLSHRYYQLKAKWYGVDKMPYWDRNAPLPEHDDRTIPWNEAEKIVLDAYGAFSPELASVGRKFFGTGWIDAPTRPGKSPGAFAHGTVPSAHPYLLLNYQGKPRDVITLAHELGHGVHQVLAAGQGALMADTPLTLAETASVFGEMLTFQSLLKSAPDQATRKAMIAGKVEDMLNTVVRQIAFFDFESRVHEERRKGELTPDAIGKIWLDIQRESLGPAFTFDEEYSAYWSYVPHFIHSPFYVYAYAFGDCLVNSLYAVYQSGLPDFQGKYLDMLKAGGVKRHKELLAPFGLDASDPAFWDKGLGVIAGFVDELEKL